MYHSLGDTETYVSPYPLTDIIQFDFKRTNQILLKSNTSSKKTRRYNISVPDSSDRGATCGALIQFRASYSACLNDK